MEQVYSNDKEELHKIIKTIEKDYQELAGYNNTLEQFGFTLVEFSRAIGDFVNFYDYFKVGEDGGKEGGSRKFSRSMRILRTLRNMGIF